MIYFYGLLEWVTYLWLFFMNLVTHQYFFIIYFNRLFQWALYFLATFLSYFCIFNFIHLNHHNLFHLLFTHIYVYIACFYTTYVQGKYYSYKKNSPFTDDEFGEKTVSILLDGEESEMIFIDHPSHEMSVSIKKINDPF